MCWYKHKIYVLFVYFCVVFLFLYKVVCFYNQENLNENLQFLTILLRIVAVYGNKRPNNYAKKWKTVI